MHFVGLDLAWGEKNQTGIAVVDADGRLLHVGVAQDDERIAASVAPFTSGDCVVAIDAPLIVTNPTGHRPCEAALNRDFHRFDAGARPAYADRPEFKNPVARESLTHSPSTWTRGRADRDVQSRSTHTRRLSCCSA